MLITLICLIPFVLSAQGILIQPGARMTVQSGARIITTSSAGIIIKADESGTGSFLDQNTSANVTFSGAQKVERYIAKDSKWHLLSCPMTGTMPAICDGNVAPLTSNFNSGTGATYDFFQFAENVAYTGGVWTNLKKSDWSVNTTDFGNPPVFVAGKGYLVQYSAAFEGSATKTFDGTLAYASTDIPVTASNNTYNLAGNPFPASLDWKHADWTSRPDCLRDDGGGYNIWIWNEAFGQYGAFNSAGSSGTNNVTQYIPPTQGFFVQAKSGGGTLTIPGGAKIHATQDIYKSSENLEDALRIKVEGSVNAYADEALIEFGHSTNEGGAAKWWSIYPEAPSIYTVKNNQNYSISFLATVNESPAVPLGFRPGADGSYTLTFSFLYFSVLKLEDRKTGIFHDLTANPHYAFTSSTDDDPARFVLHFANGNGIEDKPVQNDFSIYAHHTTVCIRNNSGTDVGGEVYIYNLPGQLMVQQKLGHDIITSIDLNGKYGYYLVKVIAGDKLYTGKVFIPASR